MKNKGYVVRISDTKEYNEQQQREAAKIGRYYRPSPPRTLWPSAIEYPEDKREDIKIGWYSKEAIEEFMLEYLKEWSEVTFKDRNPIIEIIEIEYSQKIYTYQYNEADRSLNKI